MFWMLIWVILLGVIILYTIKRYKYWERKGVKQRFSLPPLGDSSLIVVDGYCLYEMIMKIYNTFPDKRYIGVFHFTTPALMLRDPQLIKQICIKDFEHFLNHPSLLPHYSDPLWNKTLFVISGQRWRDMRVTLSPTFTISKVKQMFPLIQKCAENFVNHLTQNSDEILEMDFKDTFARYGNDIITTTAFGIECDSLKDRENDFFLKACQTLDFSRIGKQIRFVLTLMVPWFGKTLKSTIFDKDISKFFKQLVKENLEYREQNNIKRTDMIHLLTNTKGNMKKDEYVNSEDEELSAKSSTTDKNYSVDDIASQVLFLFIASFETTAISMSFMSLELALNPDIQQKLIAELDAFRATNDNKTTYEGLEKLLYFDMVVSESFRKWPPIINLDRKCNKPYMIYPERPDEKTVTLTETDNVWVPIFAIHRDPTYWENPDKFDPDRFLPENKSKIVPYTYLPFGLGHRKCIASGFTKIQIKALFYEILHYFEIVPIEKSCIPFVPRSRALKLSSASGFWFGLKKRRKNYS